MNHLEHIPDGAKVTVSVAAPILTLFGIPLQEWTYILSAIVSILFIIEKAPVILQRVKSFIRWIKTNVK